MKRSNTTIDAVLQAKIALEAVREQVTVAELATRYTVQPTEIEAWKRQLHERAARAFDPAFGAACATRYHTGPRASSHQYNPDIFPQHHRKLPALGIALLCESCGSFERQS
jgi:hypothetical protein